VSSCSAAEGRRSPPADAQRRRRSRHARAGDGTRRRTVQQVRSRLLLSTATDAVLVDFVDSYLTGQFSGITPGRPELN